MKTIYLKGRTRGGISHSLYRELIEHPPDGCRFLDRKAQTAKLQLAVPDLTAEQRLISRVDAKLRGLPCSRGVWREAKTLLCMRIKMHQRLLDDIYFEGLLSFYDSFPSDRTIELELRNTEVFYGKDARVFYNLMQKENLPSAYRHVLEEAEMGFGHAIVRSLEDETKARDLMRFLNLTTDIATS